MADKVEIQLDGHGAGTVKVDGKELTGVSDFNLRMKAGELNRLDVTMLVDEATIELAETEVKIRARSVSQDTFLR